MAGFMAVAMVINEAIFAEKTCVGTCKETYYDVQKMPEPALKAGQGQIHQCCCCSYFTFAAAFAIQQAVATRFSLLLRSLLLLLLLLLLLTILLLLLLLLLIFLLTQNKSSIENRQSE